MSSRSGASSRNTGSTQTSVIGARAGCRSLTSTVTCIWGLVQPMVVVGGKWLVVGFLKFVKIKNEDYNTAFHTK